MTRAGASRQWPWSAAAEGEASVSDVIGSILLVGITVVMAAGFGALLLSYDGPTNQVHAQLSVSVGPGLDGDWGANDAELKLRHLGGEALDEDHVLVRYSVAGGAVQEVGPTFAGGKLTVGRSWTQTISANAGDQVLVDVLVDAGTQSQLLSTGQVSAGAAPALLTYVSTITATPGWGSVTAAGNAGAANDNLNATLQETSPTGTTTTLTRTPGATTNNGASNSNVVSNDDARAVLDVAGDWVQGSSYANNPGGLLVTDLSIGFQGRGTRTCQTVTFVSGVATGAASGGATAVVSASISLTADALYVAVVTIGSTGTVAAPDVTSITGTHTGLTWTQRAQTPTLTGVNRIEVWTGVGTAVIGTVQANFASALDSNARAGIAVLRYTGADNSDPLEGTPAFTSGSSATASVGPMSGTATHGLFVGAVNGITSGGVSWTGATERVDVAGNSRARLSTADTAFAGSSITASAALGSTQPWQAFALALRPSCTAYPSVQLSYLVSNVATGTPQSFALTASDADSTIGIIGDRSWTVADIANLAVRVTLPTTVAGSSAEIDQVYLVLATSDTVTQYRAEFFLDFSSVTLSPTEVVQLRYKTNGADSFVVSVHNGTAYRTCPGLLSAITYSVFSCAIDEATEHEATSPNLRVRIKDSTPMGHTRGTLLLDYARVSGS